MTLFLLIMITSKNILSVVFLVLGLFLSSISEASIQRYPSGLGREWDYHAARSEVKRQDEKTAIQEFFKENFGQFDEATHWELWKTVRDATHHHLHYHLKYKGRRVDGVGLSLHYNLGGWIEYADSDLEELISVDFEPDSERVRARVSEVFSRNLLKTRGLRVAAWKWEPVLWKKERSNPWGPHYIVEFQTQLHGVPLFFVVDQSNGEVVSEFSKVRRFEGPSPKRTAVEVYKNSIVFKTDGTPQTPTIVTNSETITSTSLTQLTSAAVRVIREEIGNSDRKDVVPADYTSSVNFKTNPTQYNHTCSGTDSDCANQAFDAVNVFYHLQQYRNNLDLASLGLSLGNDPLAVIVNSKSITVGGVASDNAGYNPSSCGLIPNPSGPGTYADRCLIFLRPSQGSIPGCSGTQTFNNLAREGFVIVHEYQHYVTDQIAGIETTSSGVSVGDIIHEGYSDYAAASQLTRLNPLSVSPPGVTPKSEGVTKGIVSFPTCATDGYGNAVIRDVSVLQPYEVKFNFLEVHKAGLSWASGLWELHEELGVVVADKLMLKSLTFLGSNPGFVSSVESLVKADRALYSGVHVDRIRELFYSEIKFLGAAQTAFKNPTTTEAYVGFKGCSGVKWASYSGTSPVSNIAFLIWGVITLLLGRFLAKRPVS